MRFLKHLTCKVFGHEPNYFQARILEYGQLGWKNYARCARCDCSDSRKIHTIGLLDLTAWFLLGAADMRFVMTNGIERNSARCGVYSAHKPANHTLPVTA